MASDDISVEQQPPSLLQRNHEELLAVLRGGERFGSHGDGRRGIGISLQRFIRNRATGSAVGYPGDTGAGALLVQLAGLYPGCVVKEESGNAFAFGCEVMAGDESIGMSVSLGPGAQLECAVGPSTSLASLLGIFDSFDRNFHVAARSMGCDYDLVAEGYNPMVASPLDLPLVPRTEYALFNLHYAKTGRYGRDAMRACASTKVTIDYGDEADAIQTYRLAAALCPLTMFLTDNSRTLRGSDPKHTSRMVRSIVWDDVDPERSGMAPGTFDQDFSFERYVAWMESVHPVGYSDGLGGCTATNKQTTAEVMAEKALSGSEVMSLFSTVHPDVRFKRFIELEQADSLRPRSAVAYAAFLKGLFYDDESFAAARDLLAHVTEEDVWHAKETLRALAWNGNVYGMPVPDLVQRLIDIARAGLKDPAERALMDEVALPWEVRMVPRDTLVRNAG